MKIIAGLILSVFLIIGSIGSTGASPVQDQRCNVGIFITGMGVDYSQITANENACYAARGNCVAQGGYFGPCGFSGPECWWGPGGWHCYQKVCCTGT